MSGPFPALGLAPDADERTIKRAYAAKLKTVRPDEDPEGFQRLNEAYRAALQWAQSRPAPPSLADADGAGETTVEVAVEASAEPRSQAPPHAGEAQPPPSPPPAPLRVRQVPEAEPPTPAEAPASPSTQAGPTDAGPMPPASAPFDAARFHYAFALAAANASPRGFRQWLDAQPELLSLQLKPQLARSLLAFLAQEQPPMREENFEAFCACFGYDDVASGQDALQLQALARRLHLVWQAEGGERHGVTIAIGCDEEGWPAYGVERGQARIDEIERRQREQTLALAAWTRFPELRRPWSWIEMTLLCLVFFRARSIAALLRRYDRDRWPAGANPRVADFWRDAGDPSRASFARGYQRAVRALAYGGTATGLLAFAWLGDGGSPLLQAMSIVLGIVSVPLSILLIGGLLTWQVLPDPPDRLERRLRYATIPGLLLGAFVLGEIPPYSWSLIPAGWAAGMAWARYRTRSGAPGLALLIRRFLPWPWLQAVALCGLLVGLGPAWGAVSDAPWGIPLLSWSLGVFALGFWAKDAATHLRGARQG